MALTRHVLLVNSQPEVHARVESMLDEAFRFHGCTSAHAALEQIESVPFDVVIAGIKMPELDGVEFLRRARTLDPDLPVLIFTKHASVETAVAAMRTGAFDYLKDQVSQAEFRAAVERAVEHGTLAREVRRLRREVELVRGGTQALIGESSAMKQLMGIVDRVAHSEASVLILGESGTGKELLSRTVHRTSPRKDGPFVAFDCSALAPSLLESELFGHEKGAFTGAGRTRRGLFREAHRGTLFLDEIGDIAPEVQNKLLRVLQEREIKPVGADSFVKIDVRVLAATNKNLRAMVAQGTFREDLYWRLAVVPLMLPPLRDRKDDIPLLVAHILARRRNAVAPCSGDGTDPRRWPTRVTQDALARLIAYSWPGNIRELENVLSRAAILCDGDEIRAEDLPFLDPGTDFRLGAGDGEGRSLKDVVDATVRAVEGQAIKDALARAQGSPTKAAKLLGLSRASLYNKLKALGIQH